MVGEGIRNGDYISHLIAGEQITQKLSSIKHYHLPPFLRIRN